MKNSRFSRIKKGVVVFLACAVFPLLGNANEVQEKVMLMLAAVKAKDSGDFIEAKSKLEEILKVDPNDSVIQGLLISVNNSISKEKIENQHLQQEDSISPF